MVVGWWPRFFFVVPLVSVVRGAAGVVGGDDWRGCFVAHLEGMFVGPAGCVLFWLVALWLWVPWLA